jgi:tetratricopeptide (TPR) repeat protein
MARAPLVALVVTVSLASSAAADPPWTGKTVLLKRDGVTYGGTATGGKVVTLGPLRSVEQTVLSDQGQWLLVRQDGVEGWLYKEDAVLLHEAAGYFDEQLRQRPGEATLYFRRGIARERNGDPAGALLDYNEAVRRDPAVPAVWSNRAAAWLAAREYDKAVQDYTEAIRLNPRDATAHFNRGTVWAELKEYDKAVGDFDAALGLNPRYPAALQNRAVCRHSRKEYDTALRDLDEALRLDPRYALACRTRGFVWRAKGEYARAVEDFDAALRLDPGDAAAANAKAWLLATCPDAKFRNGRRAVDLARQASDSTGGKNAEYLDTLAAAHAEAGEFAEAVRLQRRVLDDAGDMKDHGEARKRLTLYEAGTPYREPPG